MSGQNRAKFDRDFDSLPLGLGPPPQRPHRPGGRATLRRPPAPPPTLLVNPIKHYGRDARAFSAPTMTWYEGPRDEPGTVEYYKTYAFRKKSQESVAVNISGKLKLEIDSKGQQDAPKRRKMDKKTLIMVFRRTNVRRAASNTKAAVRVQKANRRAKFLRSVDDEMSLFDWD